MKSAMDFAFILDPLPELKAYKDSSVAMMRALAARGHAVCALQPAGLAWQAGTVRARVAPLTLTTDDHDWYQAGPAEDRPLTSFAAVLQRKDPPFDMEYVYATYLLELAEREGARVFNRPRAIRDHNEKMAIARFADFVAPTLVTRDVERINAFIDAHRDTILKPLDGMGGASVFRVRDTDPNRNVIIETLSQYGARTVMAQRYLPEIADGDKRVLLIAGEPVPYALARIPKPGETRGNLAAGGRGEARPLTTREREIAAAVGPKLWAEGLLVVGLDVIGACLTEVNVTSPTCFVEIAQQTGFDVADMFADALLRACA
jgi:glutathione synthase